MRIPNSIVIDGVAVPVMTNNTNPSKVLRAWDRPIGCADCGVSVDPGDERAGWRSEPTQFGEVTEWRVCGFCRLDRPVGEAFLWIDAMRERFPEWKPPFWHHAAVDTVLERRFHRHADGNPDSGVTMDNDLPFPMWSRDHWQLASGSAERFAHVPAATLREFRDRLERSACKPVDVSGKVLNADAVSVWPKTLACWSCGLSLGADDDNLSRTIRVGNADWRQCVRCTPDGGDVELYMAAHLVAMLADGDAANLADWSAPWVQSAVRSMWTPCYLTSREHLHSGLEQQDPGVDVRWSWLGERGAYWLERLLARIERNRPPDPALHPSGLPCQCCGCWTALPHEWDTANWMPICGRCVPVPKPKPVNQYDAISVREAQNQDLTGPFNRPSALPRAAWRNTWTLPGAPPSGGWDFTIPRDAEALKLGADAIAAMEWRRARQWDYSDRDRAAVDAAGVGESRPIALFAHDTGFYLACEHPEYGRSAPWDNRRWSYMDHNPHGQTHADFARAAREMVYGRPPEPPKMPTADERERARWPKLKTGSPAGT